MTPQTPPPVEPFKLDHPDKPGDDGRGKHAAPPLSPRGTCPTLATPMAVADGLLARFHPVRGLAPAQLAALGRAAQAFGNGRIEVTARGSVQVRGLSRETEEDFRAALDAAGIEAKTGVAIEISPIAGEDAEEVRDPRWLAERIGAVCEEAMDRGALSPKLSIVLDGGGQIPLSGLKADVRLVARADGWMMALGGVPVGIIAEAVVPDAVAEILRGLQAIGPRARGNDLVAGDQIHTDVIPAFIAGIQRDGPASTGPVGVPLLDPGNECRGDIGGVVILKGENEALRIGVPFGQLRGAQLVALAQLMETHGVAEARPAPERTLVLIEASERLSPALAALGFGASGLSLCSGAEAAEGGVIHAADLARTLVGVAPGLADGSFHLHVSTCAKGCAYAGRPGIVLAGNALTIYRDAAQKPFARLDPAAIEAGLVSIAAQIRAMWPGA